MIKVILTTILLTTIIFFSGVYGQTMKINLNDFVSVSKAYFESISMNNSQDALHDKYINYCKDIVHEIYDDSYRAKFEKTIEFASGLPYGERVLFRDVMKMLEERLTYSVMNEHFGDYTVERFVQRRLEYVKAWREENIAGNDEYMKRLRILQALHGQTINYKNIIGEQLTFEVASNDVESIEFCDFNGESCVKVVVGNGSLRWTQYFQAENMVLLKTVQNFIS